MKKTKKEKWRRWSKRSNDEIGRPLSVSDTFSGLMDIRRLVGGSPEEIYDTGSGVITLSGSLPPSPAVVPPIQLNQVGQESADWKVGLVAVSLAGAVVLGLALAVMMRDTGRTASAPGPSATPAAAIVVNSAGAEVDGPPSLPAGASERGTSTKMMISPKPLAKAATPVLAPPAAKPHAKKTAVAKQHKPEKIKKHRKSRSAKAKHSRTESIADGPRPKSLSRGQVKAGMNRVAGKVKRCGKGKSGLLLMDVVIGSNGRVVRATPTGALAGTKTGKCASKAVRRAVFPEFSGPRFGVKYPFRL